MRSRLILGNSRYFSVNSGLTVPEADWEERHRGREWLPAEVAAERLKQAELRPMVLALADGLGA